MNKTMYETTKDVVLAAPLPLQDRTYKPVSNKQLIDLTLESIDRAGFKLHNELYSTAREGKQTNAVYTIRSVADSEMELMIGWQNSYDKSLSLKFAIGAEIFICTNGAVRGDMGTFKRKHMGEIQTFAPAQIQEYIKGAGDTFGLIQKDREHMKSIELDKRTKAELIGRLFLEEEAITVTQLGIIKRELESPTHDYGAPNSAWELYNYSTFALKGEHPSKWLESHQNVHKFFTAI